MKKTILTFLLIGAFTLSATEPQFSMYKKSNFKINQSITESRKFGKLITAAGGFIILGGITQALGSTQESPKFDANSMDIDSWNNKYDQWKKDQLTFKLTAAGLYTIGGVCLLFAGDDLLSHKIAENNTTTLKVKANTKSIGLCLNFK